MAFLGVLSLFVTMSTSTLDWGLRVEQRTSINSDRGHLHRLRFQAEPWATQELSEHWKVRAEVRGFVDPGVMPSTTYPNRVEKDEGYGFEAREAFFEYKDLPYTVRLGIQEVVWGEALHFFSADILHSKDYRDGFLNSISWARRPQLGGLVTWDSGDWSLQFVYFPFSSLNRYPRLGSDFFLTRYDVEAVGFKYPDEEGLFEFSKPTVGYNLGFRKAGVDVHVLGALLRDPQRYYRQDSSGGHYLSDRLVTFATTASYTMDDFLGRFEVAWTPARRVNSFSGMAFSDHRVGEINSIVSVDFTRIENIILSANYYWNKKYHCQPNQVLPCSTHQEGLKLLWMNLPFQSEFETGAWVELKDPSAWWSTTLRKAFTDHLKASFSIEQFFGSGTTIYSEWSRSDQVVFSLEGQW